MAEIGPYFFALGSQTVAPNFFDLGANGSSEFFCTVQRCSLANSEVTVKDNR